MKANKFDIELKTYTDVIQFSELSIERQVEIIERGFTKQQLSDFKDVTSLTYIYISMLTGVTDRTLHLKQGDERFSLYISDLIAQLIVLYGFGYKVFGNPSIFNKFMYFGCIENEYMSPMLFCHTALGRDELKRKIIKIKKNSYDETFEYLFGLPPIPLKYKRQQSKELIN